MANVVKTEDSPSLYGLEYRSSEDDAWYSVLVVLDDAAETLTVKYMCSPSVYDFTLSAGDFDTEARVEELIGRFRPVSPQLQDYQCPEIKEGTTVCAAHGTSDDDLRFYDAVVDAVHHKAHLFADGEEECLCTFTLSWQHGRGRGFLTPANIASICFLEPVTQIDPRINAFAKMAKKKITSSKSIPATTSLALASNGSPNDKENSYKKEESPQNIPRELDARHRLQSTYKSEAKTSNCDKRRSQDEDMGPRSCITGGLATTNHRFFIIINNLEKDLAPLPIMNFIFEKTSIRPEACVFPRQLLDPFARGAIMVDCQKKAETILEFLENPNHLVVSSKGRPWVITKKALPGTFGQRIWHFAPENRVQEEVNDGRSCRQLEIVVAGSESYKKAKKLKELFVEFLHHESQVSKRLVLAENEVLRSS